MVFDGPILHAYSYKKGSKTSSQELRWTPRLNFRNLLEFTENSREDWYSVYSTTKDSNGATVQLPKVVVCYKMRGTAKFHMKFDMHSFPFDSQDLCINVYSCYQDVHSEKEKKRTLKQLSERSSLTAAARMYNITIEKNRSPTYKSIVPREDEFLLRDEYILSTEIAGISDVTDENKSAQGFKYPVLLLSVNVISLVFLNGQLNHLALYATCFVCVVPHHSFCLPLSSFLFVPVLLI